MSTPEEVNSPARAALVRAVDGLYAHVHISGGEGMIEFTEDGFQAWYLDEIKQVRAKVADEALDLAAVMSSVSRASAHALRTFAQTLDEDLDDRITRGERK